MVMTVEHSSKLAWVSACALSLWGGCATEIQEPSDTQGLATTEGGGGAGGSSGGESGQQTGGTAATLGGAGNGAGAAGAPSPSEGGSSGGHGGGAGGVSAGSGGGGAAGQGGMGGAGGSGGMSGAAGKGGAGGSGGAGGTGAMPNPCEKAPLKITGATASSTENDTFPASKAFDGDAGTRWASAQSEPQWIYFDLGEVAHVSRVSITWETAYATNYRVEIAQTAAGPWTSMFQETAGNGAVDDLMSVTPRNGRYVRVYATTRATAYGFSIWEVTLYGDLDETCK